MPAAQPDQRGKRRVRSRLISPTGEFLYYRDISTGGMFLYADESFPVGSEIQIVLMLPRELGLVTDRMVCCHATVLRIEDDTPDGKKGIAAVIDRFALMNQI